MPNAILDDPKRTNQWFERVKADRHGTVDSNRQNIADQEIGRRDFIIDREPGENRMRFIYNTTARQSNLLLAGTLHGMLSNPAMDWISIRPSNANALRDPDAVGWTRIANRRMLSAVRSPKTRFVQNMAELYLDLPAFGMGAISCMAGPRELPRYVTRALRAVYIEVNDEGEVNTVFHETNMTARNFQQKFGEGQHAGVDKAMKKDDTETKFRVVQVITESDDPMAGMSAFNKRWVSKFWVVDDSKAKFLEVRKGQDLMGFDEIPLLTPRWSVENGQAYGDGPGLTALSDARVLNSMTKTLLKKAHKDADPPIIVTHEAMVSGMRIRPGGVNVVSPVPGFGANSEPLRYMSNPNKLELPMQMWEMTTKSVQDTFFAQRLQLLSNPNMTATQVLELVQEVTRLMAPNLGQIEAELIRPLLQRTFNLMERNGMFPPRPVSLRGMRMEISYLSPIVRAQKAQEAQSVMQVWEGAARMAEILQSPEPLDNLDADESIQVMHEAAGAPSLILTDARRRQQLRDARQQAMKEQNELGLVREGAEVAKTVSEAMKLQEAA